jgi:hypothetical protein
MSRLFYGSSNVYRFYPSLREELGLNLDLVQCTKKTVFDAHISSLSSPQSGSVIVTSVLANLIVDACAGLAEGAVTLFANQQITAHLEALSNLLEGNDGSHIFVVPPLLRIVPGIYERELYIRLFMFIDHLSFSKACVRY